MPEYTGQITHVDMAWIPLWLIPLLPFLGAALNAVFGMRLQASPMGRSLAKRLHIGSLAVSAIAVGAVSVAFAIAAADLVQLISIHEPGERFLLTHAWQMVRIGSFDVNFAFAMDPLGAVMVLVVTGVGALIHVYATGYMAADPAYWRFFSYLNLFIFSMLLLVLGDNFIVMFFGWEGVGLCSYLLIGFWYRDYKKASAGMKAFVVNRIGDFGFVAGIALLFWGLGGSWDGPTGTYVPNWQSRFVAVQAQAIGHGTEGEAAEGVEPGKPQELPIYQNAPPRSDDGTSRLISPPAGAVAPGGKPAEQPQGAHAVKTKPSEALQADAATRGTISFTSYPGARVYFGAADVEQIAHQAWTDCSTRPGWNGIGTEPAVGAGCYAVAPFVRKSIAAGPTIVHHVAIVPGDGATVVGDGEEMAALLVHVAANAETALMPVGPTVSFREIHDQLVISDATGKLVFRDALLAQKLWPDVFILRQWGGIALITLACLFFFLGATGKSAQIPLFTWLPDAMAGPTPVSALIHAATMVTAGVYMIARLNFLFSMSGRASGVVALVGVCTAVFAATIGLFQYDIKKVLAYSTVSQLGFMFIGVGVGAYWAGIFHLVTHAFFKACLFLGSGSVIHGMHVVTHDENAAQDMRNMGGLRRVMPWTARTYFIACLAITAAPIPLLAGFWSKDEILWKAFNATTWVPGIGIWALGLAAAAGTSFYMWRSYYLTFEGKHAKKAIAKKVHESPAAMTWVLWALAGLSVVGGAILGFSTHLLGGHGEPLLEKWLHPTMVHSVAKFHEGSLGLEYALMVLSVLLALTMWAVARKMYGPQRDKNWEERERSWPGFSLLNHKYYVDEIYDRSFVRAVHFLRHLFADMDRYIVDGLVNAAGGVTKIGAWLAGLSDKNVVDGTVNAVAEGVLAGGSRLRRVQTGRIQTYVYGILGGVLFFALLRYLLL